MAVTRASKLISLTEHTTGGAFTLSTNKIIHYQAALSTKSRVKYINQRGQIVSKIFDESVSTIHTATLSNTLYASQALTLTDDASTVLYVMCDRIIYLDTRTSTYAITYDEGSEAGIVPVVYEFSTPTAINLNTANGNTFIITTQPTSSIPSSSRYINNLFVDSIVGEAVGENPEITFTTEVKPSVGFVTTAGTGYTGPTVTITGGGGSLATGTVTSKAISGVYSAAGTGYTPSSVITLTGGTATAQSQFNVTETQLVSLATNAAGTGYTPGNVLTLVGGTFSSAATLTVTHTQAVSATVAAGGTGDLAASAGVIVEGTTGTGTKFRASVTINGANAITSVQSISTAGDYTVNPTLITAEPVIYISGGAGGSVLTGATLSVIMGVLTAAVTTGGTYTVNTATFTSTGAGTGATFNTAAYGVRTLTVAVAGDYSVLPALPVAQGSATGGGTGATITVSFGILAFTITAAGGGYTSYPTFTVVDATGINAVITAQMRLESPMTIVDAGSNLNTAPILTFSASTGTVATATTTLDAAAQNISGTTITDVGAYKKGTDAYPTLTISGGSGCQVLYDEKRTEFKLLQLEETVATVTAVVNGL